MTTNKYLQEVEKAIYAIPAKKNKNDIAFLKKYIGTRYNIIGLTVPLQRAISKKGFSFSTLSIKEQLTIWDEIWNKSNSHDVMSQGLLFWERHLKNTDPGMTWKHLKNWVSKIDNWAHSDSLSGFYSYLLEVKPDLVLPQLKKWNKSKNPWERRQSVVSLTHYHRMREKILPYNTLIALVENLLTDEHYFVQKGVGWALREIGQEYPEETFAFLKKNYAKITGVAFAAATEKLSIVEKEELKQLRKKARKK